MKLSHTVTKNRKIYGNWKVYSPDGFLMFRCDDKKANWYLNKNLAHYIDGSNFEIKLDFDPNGLGNYNKDYGTHLMSNKCVNCGSKDFLTRHHVVPYCYRKNFPISQKSHKSHDILSLCSNCHETYEFLAFEKKKEISDKYMVPININVVDKDLLKMKKLAICLSSKSNVPKDRILSIKLEIKEHFGWKRLTKSRLNYISNLDVKIAKNNHGEKIVSKIKDINSFIKEWRQHFLDNNECKFLPKNWSVDYE